MNTTTLDHLSTAIERVVKNLRAAPTAKKRMPLADFVNHALAQLGKAAQDEPDVAQRRLAALKRSVDDVITKVGKMIAEDTDSESIQVEVETAFAPTKADGDRPMADLTTAGDQSSSDVSLTGIAAATGDTAFAENLKAVAKTLQALKADLEEPAKPKTRTPAKKSDGNQNGRRATRDAGDGDVGAGEPAGEGWPLDLNTDAFLQGKVGDETEQTWGADPDGVASAKPR